MSEEDMLMLRCPACEMPVAPHDGGVRCTDCLRQWSRDEWQLVAAMLAFDWTPDRL